MPGLLPVISLGLMAWIPGGLLRAL
jgi:hypothetical protein